MRSLEVFFALVRRGVQPKPFALGATAASAIAIAEASSEARPVVLGEPMARGIILKIDAGSYRPNVPQLVTPPALIIGRGSANPHRLSTAIVRFANVSRSAITDTK